MVLTDTHDIKAQGGECTDVPHPISVHSVMPAVHAKVSSFHVLLGDEAVKQGAQVTREIAPTPSPAE